MSKTLIVFCFIYVVCGLGTFIIPQMGVWGFLIESNYHPPFRHWGRPLMHLGDRWSFYIGAAMLASMLLHWGAYQRVPFFKHTQSKLLLLFTVNAFIVTGWAYNAQDSWKESVDYLKWLAVFICIVKTHSNRKWLPIILYIYILSCIHAGWDSTIDPTGGRGVRGGPVTVGDENFMAAHAVALLPLVGFFAMSPNTNRWIRLSCVVGVPLILNIVAHSQSRGAFLALVGAGLSMLFVASGRLRALTLAGLLVGCLFGLRLFHEEFWERMSTIENYEEDRSATGRVEAWTAAWILADRNPFGYGAEAFDSGLPEKTIGYNVQTTHNMFFEILVAWGWQGVILFFGFIAFTAWDCWKLRGAFRQLAQWPPRPEYLEAAGILAGLVAMLIASIFLNRVRWELWWIFGAYVVCLKNIHAEQLQSQLQHNAVHQTPYQPGFTRAHPHPKYEMESG